MFIIIFFFGSVQPVSKYFLYLDTVLLVQSPRRPRYVTSFSCGILIRLPTYQIDVSATYVLDILHGSIVSHQASVVSLVEPPFPELSILIRITLLALIRIRLFNRMWVRNRPPIFCGSRLATLDRIWPKYTYRVPFYAIIPLNTRTCVIKSCISM